jgi:plasmid maintenance system antidote protein VapI
VSPHEFRPDWTIAPGVMLEEWMEENGLSSRVLAVACGGRGRIAETMTLIGDVVERRPLTGLHARVLAAGTGISALFWLALEHDYRAGLAAGLTDASDG